MSARLPPVLAVWLLRHFGASYHGDALEGDLFEEYQCGRTRRWYWRQIFVSLVTALAQRVRAPLLLASGFAAATILRALTEGVLILGAAILVGQLSSPCPLQAAHSRDFVAFVGALAVALSVGRYLVLRHRESRTRTQPQVRRLIATFALSALSVGTLTWAGTACVAPGPGPQCSCGIAAVGAAR